MNRKTPLFYLVHGILPEIQICSAGSDLATPCVGYENLEFLFLHKIMKITIPGSLPFP